MVSVTAKNGSYLIAFSERQTPEEWELIKRAMELEKRQHKAEYAQSSQNQTTLVGGIDWNKWRMSASEASVQEQNFSSISANQSLPDRNHELYLDLSEWTEIIGIDEQ